MVDFSDFYRVDIFAYNRFKLASGFHLYWLLIVNMQFLCLSIENARFIIFVARSLRTKKATGEQLQPVG
jgi:hypothetical protein